MSAEGSDAEIPNPRDLIIALRGGVPPICPFCREARPEHEMEPLSGGEWACGTCLDRWERGA